MNKPRENLVNFSVEKNNYLSEKFPAPKNAKNNHGSIENPKFNICNERLSKLKNLEDDLKKNTDKILPGRLKTNNSAADLHNIKHDIRNNSRKDSKVNDSEYLASPKQEKSSKKLRSNTSSKAISHKLSNNPYRNSNPNLLDLHKENLDSYKKSNSLFKSKNIDYNFATETNKLCNKEILKLQKNNRNRTESINSTYDNNKIISNCNTKKFVSKNVVNPNIKEANYQTFHSVKGSINSVTNSNQNNHPPKYGSKPILQKNLNKEIINPIINQNIQTNFSKNIQNIQTLQKSQNPLPIHSNESIKTLQISDKLRMNMILPVNLSPKLNDDEIKSLNSLGMEYKSNSSITSTLNSQNASGVESSYKSSIYSHSYNNPNTLLNNNVNKISLDKNCTIGRLKNKIYKKFANFNQSNISNKPLDKNKLQLDKNGTIINISNNINNNFHIMINPQHSSVNLSKSNTNLDNNISKITSQTDHTSHSKISTGDNLLLKSNIRFKSNLSSFKELTMMQQKLKNFVPGNSSFSKNPELKKTKMKNEKDDYEFDHNRLKANLYETVDNKYDDEFEKYLNKDDFMNKEVLSKINMEDVNNISNKNTNIYRYDENVNKQKDKTSVSEQMFNLYMNKNSNNKDQNKNKNKNIILSNKEFYSSNDSNSFKGSLPAKKQSESGSLLSDESIFEISRMNSKNIFINYLSERRVNKRNKNTNSSINKLSQSLKFSSESVDKKSMHKFNSNLLQVHYLRKNHPQIKIF